MPTSDPLSYDSPEYAAALDHLGTSRPIEGWPSTLLCRTIPGAGEHLDATGPWPYSSAPSAEGLIEAMRRVRASGLVTLRVVLRPDAEPDHDALRREGAGLVQLKEHFVFDPQRDRPEPGPRTRRHLSVARRQWHVEPVVLADHEEAFGAWHDALLARKRHDRITALPRQHFRAIARIEGFEALGAFDREGIGALLIACRTRRAMHFHVIAGADRAYRTSGFYALYDAAIRLWGGTRALYLGGAPTGPDGDGIARFKRRFANRRTPIWMLTCVPDPDACAQLARTLGPARPGWFPPYRG